MSRVPEGFGRDGTDMNPSTHKIMNRTGFVAKRLECDQLAGAFPQRSWQLSSVQKDFFKFRARFFAEAGISLCEQ